MPIERHTSMRSAVLALVGNDDGVFEVLSNYGSDPLRDLPMQGDPEVVSLAAEAAVHLLEGDPTYGSYSVMLGVRWAGEVVVHQTDPDEPAHWFLSVPL